METSSEIPESSDSVQDVIDAEADVAADDASARLWIRTLTVLLQTRPAEPDQSERVQKALDRLWIAAADRASRILRGDIVDH